jgi:hypothetical protein
MAHPPPALRTSADNLGGQTKQSLATIFCGWTVSAFLAPSVQTILVDVCRLILPTDRLSSVCYRRGDGEHFRTKLEFHLRFDMSILCIGCSNHLCCENPCEIPQPT